jgi:hypothetical protein
MSDIEAILSQILDPQALYLPGPHAGNHCQHIGKLGPFIFPLNLEDCRRQFGTKYLPFRRLAGKPGDSLGYIFIYHFLVEGPGQGDSSGLNDDIPSFCRLGNTFIFFRRLEGLKIFDEGFHVLPGYFA